MKAIKVVRCVLVGTLVVSSLVGCDASRDLIENAATEELYGPVPDSEVVALYGPAPIDSDVKVVD